jgi:hypothetical protein
VPATPITSHKAKGNAMSDTITCPECQAEIEVTEVMQAQLAATIRSEMQAEFAEKARKLSTERDELAKAQTQLADSQAEFNEQVKVAVATERDSLAAKLRVEAQQAVAIEIADRDEQLAKAKSKLKEFESQELELRRKTRELQEQAEQQELEVARTLDLERQKIRDSALKQADEQLTLKLAERDQKIEALGKQLQDAQRKLEQGSQQTQGDVQEVALETLLSEAFPHDVIERVGKGASGGDVLHHVFDHNGRECGVILWESKRTKAWNGDWIGKAIDDQQAAKATVVCVVSSVLPKDVEHIDQCSGVWIASWSCTRLAADLLRHCILEVSQARAATEGQNGKMELLYNYMSSDEFRSRLRGIAEPYQEMEKDLQSEMRVINARWKKRRKQLDRVMLSATGLYGDLQGIIGSSLQQIKGMELLALESDVDESAEENQTVSTEDA